MSCLCRTLLAAVALSCTLSNIHAHGQATQRLDRIKDLMCVLLLSGMQKEDLDVSMLNKLQRHNVNIGDVNNEELLQECTRIRALENQNKSFEATTTANNENLDRENIDDVSMKNYDGSTANDKKESTTKDIIQYNDGQPDIQSVLKFWQEKVGLKVNMSNNTPRLEHSMDESLLKNEQKNKRNVQSNTNYKETDTIQKLLANFVVQGHYDNSVQSTTSKGSINGRKQYFAPTFYDNFRYSEYNDHKSSSGSNRVKQIDPYEGMRQIIKDSINTSKVTTERNKSNVNLNDMLTVFNTFKSYYPVMANIRNNKMINPVQDSHLSIEAITEKISTTTAKVSAPKIPQDMIKEIAISVKDMILSELRKEFFKTTTTIPTTVGLTSTKKETDIKMAEKKTQKHWNSLESRKRKVDSISRYQSKMLRVDAEYYCDADQSSTSIEKERSILEETIVKDKYYAVDNNNFTNTQRPSGNSLQSSDNSSEVICDRDEENYCKNENTFSNIIRQQSKVHIKINEKVSKRELKRYLWSAKFGEISVVPTNNNILLPPPLAICQKQKSQQFNTQATPTDDILTVDLIQDMPPGDVVSASEPEIKKIIQTTPVDKLFTADVIPDIPTGEVVFPPKPEIKKVTQITAIDEVVTADIIQDMPPDDVFAPKPEIKKIIQTTPIDEVLTADVVQDMPLGDVILAPAPEIKKITQTCPINEVLTADVIQDMPPNDFVFAPAPEIKKITQTTPSDVILEPQPNHSHEVSCTEIVRDNVDQSTLFQQSQVYTSLKTVVFEHEPKNIEDNKGSPSLINIDTSFFDQATDTSDHELNSEHPKPSNKFRTKILKSYVDYLSDNEDFSAGSSNSWSMNESESSINSENKKKKFTKKKQKIIDKNEKRTNTIENLIKYKVKKENKSKLRKQQKTAGKSYETRSGSIIEEKSMKRNPCLPGVCARKCYEVSEDRRMSLFKYFWTLDVQRRKDWIVRCAQPMSIKRKKTKCVESRRSQTLEYVINEGEGSRPVCQKFLINTLDITQKFILYTVKNAQESMASVEKRTCHAEKYSDEDKAYAKAFIESLPAVLSHYCRKKSSCLYLPQEFKNASNLFRIYLKHCQNNSKLHLSEKVFLKIFNDDYNIRFHIPKKDKCVICTKAENTELLSEKEIKDMAVHLEEKKASYQRFKIHQKLISNDTLTVSFDLQKVLNTPHGESMLLYYSRKYAVYNCTFYESQTKIGHCYIWGESDGKRGGNEIATCIYKFLIEIDKRPVKNVLLYCDSCPGQNKNKIVLTALHYFLQYSKNIEVVQINYLLPGHTYMPVDSMHAVIEREVKRIIVWSPSQWPTYIESARKRPEPYKINVLEYSDFINWDSLVSEKFTNSSQRQIQLKAIRIVTFKKKNAKSMVVKYSMNENEDSQIVTLYHDEYKGRGSKGKGKGKKTKRQNQEQTGADKVEDTSSIGLATLYNKPNPISVAKYNDLKRLCTNGIIPKRFHKDYLDLPTLGTVKDILPETDEEDDNDTIDL